MGIQDEHLFVSEQKLRTTSEWHKKIPCITVRSFQLDQGAGSNRLLGIKIPARECLELFERLDDFGSLAGLALGKIGRLQCPGVVFVLCLVLFVSGLFVSGSSRSLKSFDPSRKALFELLEERVFFQGDVWG